MVSVRSRWHLRRERCSWAAEHGRSRGAGPAKGQSYLRTSQGKDWLPNARRGGASRGSAAWYQLGGHSLHRERAVRRPVGTSSGASLFERFCPPTASREPRSAILLNGIRASGQDRWVARVSRQTVHLKRRNACRSLQPARAWKAQFECRGGRRPACRNPRSTPLLWTHSPQAERRAAVAAEPLS